jgi:hypothetical protein
MTAILLAFALLASPAQAAAFKPCPNGVVGKACECRAVVSGHRNICHPGHVVFAIPLAAHAAKSPSRAKAKEHEQGGRPLPRHATTFRRPNLARLRELSRVTGGSR